MKRILIVDDHALFRSGLEGLFNSQPDFTVVGEAGNIKEAIQKAQELQPDLVIMDLGLPDGSGLEAMDKILLKVPHTKIVFLTIHDEDQTAFAAIRHGAKGFLLKNIPATKLLSALRGLERGELAIPREMLSRFLVEVLRLVGPHQADHGISDGLTRREIEVLGELGTGLGNRQIADRLSISENTVKVHVHNILEKLNMSSRREAAKFSQRYGLSNPPG